MKDYYTRQAEDYAGVYKDNDGNVYDLHCYCGYWSLFLRVGNNGHTKTIIGNEDLTACLREIKKRGLTKKEKKAMSDTDMLHMAALEVID